MSNRPPSPQHAQEIPKTPPNKDKTTTTTTATTTATTTPRPTHIRKVSQQTISTPLPIHRRQISRAQSHDPSTTTPLPLHHQNPLSDLDPTFPLTYYDSPTHFSPSKARAAAQASHQLGVLQRWLTALLTDTDRNSAELSSTQHALLSKWSTQHQTLTATNPDLASQSIQWLEATMAANCLSDERRRLVFEARKAELERFEQYAKRFQQVGRGYNDDNDDGLESERPDLATTTDLLELIASNLTPSAETSLTSLSRTSILLGQLPSVTDSTPLPTSLSQAVIDHTIRAQDLQEQVDELQILQGKLERELGRAKRQLKEFEEVKRVADRMEEEVMRPQTAQWIRETKQIAMKIQEYKDRVAVLERSRPGSEGGRGNVEGFVRVEDVVELQDRVRERRLVVRKLEENVKTLSGLPPDLEASRDEVKRAKSELEKLKARREELFEILAAT